MAPFRNPFTRRPGAPTATEDHLRPEALASPVTQPGFERVDTVGSKASSAISIRSWRSERSMDNGDYKMSVVNDSGIYLPPSPTEEKGLWPRHYESGRKSPDTKSSLGEIEHFGISRESFDSYRRSFDVSARSPVTHEPPTRASFDCTRLPRLPRSALDGRRLAFESKELTPEEFEDVGLEDKSPAVQQPTRKRGFFSKFSTTSTITEASTNDGQAAVTRWIGGGGGGRKRATSNSQGSELKSMEKPTLVIESPTSLNEGTAEEAKAPSEAPSLLTPKLSS